jgi:hypothetical protein
MKVVEGQATRIKVIGNKRCVWLKQVSRGVSEHGAGEKEEINTHNQSNRV